MDPEASECLVIMVAARVNRTDETPVSEGQPISGGERDSGGTLSNIKITVRVGSHQPPRWMVNPPDWGGQAAVVVAVQEVLSAI